jgi:transcriptional regulator with PAS, ATPase and Fis domain
MEKHAWVDSFPGSITVCDREGRMVEMNLASAQFYAADGGLALLGSDLLDCHPEPSRTKLSQMMESQQANIYTSERAGQKKLVCHVPWYQDGVYAGYVELMVYLPTELPHFIRD